MGISSVFLTILWLVCIPIAVGSFFTLTSKNFVTENLVDKKGVLRSAELLMWSWFLGQLFLWCIFQIISVIEILRKSKFDRIVKEYTVIAIAAVIVALIFGIVRQIKSKIITGLFFPNTGAKSEGSENNKSKVILVAWIAFWVLLVAQMVLLCVLAYMDVDDSFYVSEAVSINSSNNMYNLIPYTGMTTEMDFRHSLEPFPVWLAYISRMTKNNVTVMAHVLLPVFMLPLTYGTYALMGSRLLGTNRKNLPVFLVVTELLVMFSLYSTKSPDKFFITRIRQGKATLASLILPGIVMCLFLILQYAKENRRTDFRIWIMLFMLDTAGCLCSTLGALLCVIPVAVVAVMMIFAYKKGWHLIPMIIGCLPCLVYALLYVVKG